jgi:crotonobetainyl-CoA:carnitine CoA-transferase CaiB-like acyl-CoA transferase
VLDAEYLADDPRFARTGERTANRSELRELLVERLASRSAADWFRALTSVGVPCGPINSVAQGVAFATEIGLDPVVLAGQGDAAVPGIRHPLEFSASPPRYELPPPDLDEHGAQIREWLAL